MEIHNRSGIYQILNTANGKRYIGSAVNFGRRWRAHRSTLRRGVSASAVLQNAWNKYGENAFEFSVLLFCAPADLLLFEQRCLDGFMPEYNIARIAGSSLGVKHSPEFRAMRHILATRQMACPEMRDRLRAANTGRTTSSETRAKISLALKGHEVSEETRAKLVAANTGRTHTPESKKKMSVSATGHTLSPEGRAKVSRATKGRQVSEETRAKHRHNTYALGYRHTPEAIEKITTAARNPSAETRAKLSAAANRRWDRYRSNKELQHAG